MTTLLLIRHASTGAVGRVLSGRSPGIGLTGGGRHEAESLARRLAQRGLEAVYSSPLERAQQTAALVAQAAGVPVQTREALAEVQYGEWNGAQFSELARDSLWRRFNSFRSGTRIPGGELMIEVQMRMVAELTHIRGAHPQSRVAVVSHADPIKLAIGYFLGIPIDLLHRIELAPASISEIALDENGASIIALNEHPDLPAGADTAEANG